MRQQEAEAAQFNAMVEQDRQNEYMTYGQDGRYGTPGLDLKGYRS